MRLAEYGWRPRRDGLAQAKAYRGPRFTGICMNNRGASTPRVAQSALFAVSGMTSSYATGPRPAWIPT